MIAPENVIWISMLLPLAAVGLIYLFGSLPNVREGCTIIVSIFLFALTCHLASHVFAGERPTFVLGEMVPGFEIAFEVEPLGMLFALVASGLWILTTIYAIGYMRGHHEKNQTRFFACFALAIFAALSAAYAKNLFTLFVAYEVMTISTYPLVTHHGDEKAKQGGRVYLGILLSTSIAFFMLAIVWTQYAAGTLDFVEGGILTEATVKDRISNTGLAILLGLFAFGIGKAALMPFHRWLPAAMVAPTPVSALLHAVAVVKVGVFSILKVVVYIFGIELIQITKIGTEVSQVGMSDWLCYLAAASILIASLVAMTKDNLKARLAYSTVSQLAYITLGAALATQKQRNRWRYAHRDACGGQDYVVFLCGCDLCWRSQGKHQRYERSWTRDAIYVWCVLVGQLEHYRFTTWGRLLEQVVFGRRNLRVRSCVVDGRIDDQLVTEHCLSCSNTNQGLHGP